MSVQNSIAGLFFCLSLPILLDGAATLREIRHFFPEEEQPPVAGQFAKPQYYYGSDLYSKPVEGPLYSRYGIEFEIAPLFYLARDASEIDGRVLHYGFTVSIGVPLSRAYRPNHYLNLEVLGAFDSTDIPYTIPVPSAHPTSISTESQMLSILVNYKYYTPPLIRERVYPYLSAGIGNSFKSVNASTLAGTLLDESDDSIITFQGGVGFRTRITNNFGLRTGYHMLLIGRQDYDTAEEGSDILHALDMGLSLSF
jgi:opacity protein-like surface antigen